ncbi:hypothetical protein F2P81_003898 [Scophthalmus maximus]|uniref:Iodothyronine deiodinase n=1 Tax=Scophthalmus maximus TaxID=52904 RepID=A0A6A4TM81_SCOMX|nr:hypothetical protein F2P81_003898 [Scophthalmus maximus]
MGMASEDLLVTLQILPGFFSNCLFLVLYDSVVLVKRVVALLSSSRSGGSGEWRRMLTSAGLRSIWNSFLLDAYKQVHTRVTPRPSVPGVTQRVRDRVLILYDLKYEHRLACFFKIHFQRNVCQLPLAKLSSRRSSQRVLITGLVL